MSNPGPRSRKKNVTGQAEDVSRRGSGLGTGPVGTGHGPTPSSSSQPASGSRPATTPARPASSSRPSTTPARPASGSRPASAPSRPASSGNGRPSGYSSPERGGYGAGSSASRPSASGSARPGASRPASARQSGSAPSLGGILSAAGKVAGSNGQNSGSQHNGGGKKSSGILKYIIIALVLFFVISRFTGNDGDTGNNAGSYSSGSSVSQSVSGSTYGNSYGDTYGNTYGGSTGNTGSDSVYGGSTVSTNSGTTGGGLSSLLSQLTGGSSWYGGMLGGTSSGYTGTSSDTSSVSQSVASGSRDKYYTPGKKNKDTVTLMIYMCGTDLESGSGMATSDINEMLKADLGKNVNLLIYTGGCKAWKNNTISPTQNEIWQVTNQKLKRVYKENARTMTDPDTLSDFITYCAGKYPADRNILILWDHGSGSVSGFGYDEKFPRSGSMNLAGISKALKTADVRFDFIGFDACLMATVETALMLSPYADYMIASEESEPGIGWYYTDWLTQLGENSSASTLDLGKTICDTFVSRCARSCPGQKTTLSLVDLAELEHTAPQAISDFADSVSGLIRDQQYKTVSDARVNCREFAASNKLDQVDLADFAARTGTEAGSALSKVIKSAVKYNRTSGISDAWGLTIYFPYRNRNNVEKAVSAYRQLGMDESYTDCIRAFAGVQTTGQLASGGSNTAYTTLSGSSYSGIPGMSDLSQLLGTLFGGSFSSDFSDISGFFSDRVMSEQELATTLYDNRLDPSRLVFRKVTGTGMTLTLTADEWSQIHSIDRNVFLDDGTGYIDLGLDNTFTCTEEGNLIADTELTGLAIDGQVVAYYHTDTEDNGTDWQINGYVPALLNGQRVNLLIAFNNEHESGFVTGAATVYAGGETETVAKSMTEIKKGDNLDFLCDYYTYDCDYQDSYMLGRQITVGDSLTVSDLLLPEGSSTRILYRFTDIYDQAYWTEVKP